MRSGNWNLAEHQAQDVHHEIPLTCEVGTGTLHMRSGTPARKEHILMNSITLPSGTPAKKRTHPNEFDYLAGMHVKQAVQWGF